MYLNIAGYHWFTNVFIRDSKILPKPLVSNLISRIAILKVMEDAPLLLPESYAIKLKITMDDNIKETRIYSNGNRIYVVMNSSELD